MNDKPDLDIDASDLRCPLPVLRLQKALRGMAPGATVRLIATDPMARIDVPHFCSEAGHSLLKTTERGNTTEFLVRKTPSAAG